MIEHLRGRPLTLRHLGKLFYRLVQQAATVGPTTYSEMVQHLRGRRTGQPQDVG